MSLPNDGGIVAFTGHRHVPEDIATAGIDLRLGELQPTRVIVGGAAGADTLAAERCTEHDVPYTMALPHKDYAQKYKLDQDARWWKAFYNANEVICVVEKGPWYFGHNFKRNEWMVDHSEILIAVSEFDPYGKIPSRGGTAHCVRYARKVGRSMKWVRLTEDLPLRLNLSVPEARP